MYSNLQVFFTPQIGQGFFPQLCRMSQETTKGLVAFLAYPPIKTTPNRNKGLNLVATQIFFIFAPKFGEDFQC